MLTFQDGFVAINQAQYGYMFTRITDSEVDISFQEIGDTSKQCIETIRDAYFNCEKVMIKVGAEAQPALIVDIKHSETWLGNYFTATLKALKS